MLISLMKRGQALSSEALEWGHAASAKGKAYLRSRGYKALERIEKHLKPDAEEDIKVARR